MNSLFFFFNDTATTEIYTLSLHDALPISSLRNFATKRGRSGLGPTTLISPFKTLKNWGNSSRLVLRRKTPSRVRRGSPGLVQRESLSEESLKIGRASCRERV